MVCHELIDTLNILNGKLIISFIQYCQYHTTFEMIDSPVQLLGLDPRCVPSNMNFDSGFRLTSTQTWLTRSHSKDVELTIA